jgi:capsular polysaccharide transport system permease protein
MKAKVFSLFMLACILTFVATVYWLMLASDRYVSTAHLQVNRTDMANPTPDFLGALMGGGGSNRADQLTLRDFLLSAAMMQKLDAKLDLRSHFSNEEKDVISRLWSPNVASEWFHRYLSGRISVDFDEYSGLLMINAEAFSPDIAQSIVSMMVAEGEVFMNRSAHDLAQTQVDFLQQQLQLIESRALQSRQALLIYQNRKNMASPQATAENIQTIVAKLEAQLSELNVQRTALLAYLVPSHPSVTLVSQQITATESQLASQKARMTSKQGQPLNAAVEEYQRLQMQSGFADEIYKSALATYEKGKLEVLRTIKKISLVRPPLLPEYPMQPKRIYNSFLSMVLIWISTGVLYLMAAIVKDHRE